jgi:hypothetical protein
LRKSILVPIVIAILVTSCLSQTQSTETQSQRVVTPRPTPTTYERYQRHFFSATQAHGAPSSALSAKQQQLVIVVQSVLKPSLRSTLEYTYSATGTFVLVLRDDHFAINYCHTPKDPTDCKHDCGVALNRQTWEAVAITDFGRCQDNAPVWLDPKASLPDFQTSP